MKSNARVDLTSDETRSSGTIVPWLLLVAVPVLFGLLTWNTGVGRVPVQDWARSTGAPIIFIEIVFIGFAVRYDFRPLKILRSAPGWVFGALCLLIVIAFGDAALVAPNGQLAAMKSSMLLVHLLFALAVAHLTSEARIWPHFWPATVTGLCAFIVLLGLFTTSVADPLSFDWRRLGLSVTNVRQLGYYSAVGAGASFGILAVTEKAPTYLAATAAASVMIALSIWSGSRGALLAICFAIVCGFYVFRELRNPRMVFTVLASGVVGLILSQFHQIHDKHYGTARIAASVTHRTLDDMSGGRLAVWAATWKTILANPFFGYGDGQFRYLVPTPGGYLTSPHNIFLQILLHWGFVGLVASVPLAILLFAKARGAIRQGGSVQLPAFLVAVSLITMSVYDPTLYHTYPLMIFALCLGIIIGTPRSQPRNR